jgi:hypothetical protein
MEGLTFRMGDREAVRFEQVQGEDGLELIETPEWRTFQEKERIKREIVVGNLADIDKPYRGSDTPGNIVKLSTYIDRMLHPRNDHDKRFRSISLYLWSRKNGTQKSTVARWIGRQLIKGGLTSHMVLMSDLAVALTRKGFEDEDGWLLERLDAVDLLIVDDAFDPKKITLYKSGYQLPFLDTFLRRRLEGLKKGICFTSNVPVTEIGSIFGQSIQALVKRSAPDPMEFNDEINDFDVAELWK